MREWEKRERQKEKEVRREESLRGGKNKGNEKNKHPKHSKSKRARIFSREVGCCFFFFFFFLFLRQISCHSIAIDPRTPFKKLLCSFRHFWSRSQWSPRHWNPRWTPWTPSCASLPIRKARSDMASWPSLPSEERGSSRSCPSSVRATGSRTLRTASRTYSDPRSCSSPSAFSWARACGASTQAAAWTPESSVLIGKE